MLWVLALLLCHERYLGQGVQGHGIHISCVISQPVQPHCEHDDGNQQSMPRSHKTSWISVPTRNQCEKTSSWVPVVSLVIYPLTSSCCTIYSTKASGWFTGSDERNWTNGLDSCWTCVSWIIASRIAFCCCLVKVAFCYLVTTLVV